VEIAKLHRDLGATTIYVTHDQVEAMTLADRVVVLRDGQIEQVGTPLELYDRPANQFVAQFIGTPQMNVLPAAQLPQLASVGGMAVPVGGFVGLRPEDIQVQPAGQGQMQGTVELVEALGAETLIHVLTGTGANIIARQNHRTTLQPGSAVGLVIDATAAHLFDDQGRLARPATGGAAQARAA
jgi:multiple sugar transport system ATP-binding protein